MMIKQRFSGLLLTMIISATMVAVVACSPKGTTQNTAVPTPTPSATVSATTNGTTVSAAANATDTAQKTFTKDELAKYDGKNGNPAYVAVNGVVYDVTNVRQWSGGSHQGYNAGQDLTKAIQQSPHGVSVLKDLPVVGKYVG